MHKNSLSPNHVFKVKKIAKTHYGLSTRYINESNVYPSCMLCLTNTKEFLYQKELTSSDKISSVYDCTFLFQAVPIPQEEVSSADEAQAAKRRRLPSSSAPPADTPMETTSPRAGPPTATSVAAPAGTHKSISTLQTSQPLSQPSTTPRVAPAPPYGIQMGAETPMDMSALTESTLASDTTLTPQTAHFHSTLNSDPLLSTASLPQLPPPLMSDSYTPSSGYVSYMETLLHSHFPQDDGPGPLY